MDELRYSICDILRPIHDVGKVICAFENLLSFNIPRHTFKVIEFLVRHGLDVNKVVFDQ